MVPSLVPWDARNAIVCAVVGDLDKRDDPENHAKDGEETCTAGKSVILLDLFNFVFVLAFRSTLPHEIAAAAAQAVHECLDQGDNTSTRGAEQEDDARDAKARETKQKKTCQTQPPPAKVETTDAKRAQENLKQEGDDLALPGMAAWLILDLCPPVVSADTMLVIEVAVSFPAFSISRAGHDLRVSLERLRARLKGATPAVVVVFTLGLTKFWLGAGIVPCRFCGLWVVWSSSLGMVCGRRQLIRVVRWLVLRWLVLWFLISVTVQVLTIRLLVTIHPAKHGDHQGSAHHSRLTN